MSTTDANAAPDATHHMSADRARPMSDLRDELAAALIPTLQRVKSVPLGGDLMPHACAAANALLPIITRETERARAEVADLIRAHQNAEATYWAMADDADDETARRLAAAVTRTYEELLASVEGES